MAESRDPEDVLSSAAVTELGATPSNDAWTAVHHAAWRALTDGTVFTSAVRAQRYRVTAVERDRVIVERLDANAAAVLTRGAVDVALRKVRRAGGRVARASLFSTVAQEAALVALHPALRRDTSGDWIELAETIPAPAGGSPVVIGDMPTGTPSELPVADATMRPLRLYEAYTRREVHALFAPGTPFTPQAGTWGLAGAVRVPDRPGDYVFFVTFGQRQGEHAFDESVTADGVVTWQSQPQQTLQDPRVREWVGHDDARNAIHLFLRTRADQAYTYLGRLRYLTHDAERERPVHFQWQLVPGGVPTEVAARIGLELAEAPTASASDRRPTGHIEPSPGGAVGSDTGAEVAVEHGVSNAGSSRSRRRSWGRDLGRARRRSAGVWVQTTASATHGTVRWGSRASGSCAGRSARPSTQPGGRIWRRRSSTWPRRRATVPGTTCGRTRPRASRSTSRSRRRAAPPQPRAS